MDIDAGIANCKVVNSYVNSQVPLLKLQLSQEKKSSHKFWLDVNRKGEKQCTFIGNELD